MSHRASRRWVVGNLQRYAKQQQGRIKKRPGEPVRPREQVRRFLAGEEAWRVDAGLVTPEQYEQYVRAMERKLQGG